MTKTLTQSTSEKNSSREATEVIVQEMEGIRDDLDREDLLGAILRGHLWLDAALNDLISTYLRAPEHLDTARVPFPTKLGLVAGLHGLAAREISGAAELNRLRNRLAHNLGAEVTQDDQQRIMEAVGRPPAEFPEGLRDAIFMLVAKLRAHVLMRRITGGSVASAR